MKITKDAIKVLVQEELNKIVNEEEIEEITLPNVGSGPRGSSRNFDPSARQSGLAPTEDEMDALEKKGKKGFLSRMFGKDWSKEAEATGAPSGVNVDAIANDVAQSLGAALKDALSAAFQKHAIAESDQLALAEEIFEKIEK